MHNGNSLVGTKLVSGTPQPVYQGRKGGNYYLRPNGRKAYFRGPFTASQPSSPGKLGDSTIGKPPETTPNAIPRLGLLLEPCEEAPKYSSLDALSGLGRQRKRSTWTLPRLGLLLESCEEEPKYSSSPGTLPLADLSPTIDEVLRRTMRDVAQDGGELRAALCDFASADQLDEALCFLKNRSVSAEIVTLLSQPPNEAAITKSGFERCLNHMAFGEWLEAQEALTVQLSANNEEAQMLSAISEHRLGFPQSALDVCTAYRDCGPESSLLNLLRSLVAVHQHREDVSAAFASTLLCEANQDFTSQGKYAALSPVVRDCVNQVDALFLAARETHEKYEETSADSTREMWERAGESNVMKELLTLTGIPNVKNRLLDLKKTVELDKERGEDLSNKQFNAIFTGNPGTGKTTVARQYGELLTELGALPDTNGFVETSGAKLLAGGMPALITALAELVDDGVSTLPAGYKVKTDLPVKGKWHQHGTIVDMRPDGTYNLQLDRPCTSTGQTVLVAPRNRLRSIERGGTLFIDEAYQLDPSSNSQGRQILDYLLTETDNMRGLLVTVFAGYAKKLDDLMEHNEGLPSRFPRRFHFEDFTDRELETIMCSLVEPRYSFEDDKHARIASRRLGRQRNTAGFGNARAVRNMCEHVHERQSARVIAQRKMPVFPGPDEFKYVRDGVLGARTIDRRNNSALCELNSMYGLTEVKQSVEQLVKVVESNAEREEAEQKLQDLSLNRIFLGNPGTGKTSVAKIYGKVLHELGLLSKGDVVVKNPSDFIGSALGESEKKTSAILDATVGCVLVIDEGI